MANTLRVEKKDQIRELFVKTGSIRGVAKITGLSRNTIRGLIRREGLSVTITKPSNFNPLPPKEGHLSPIADCDLTHIDFKMLSKMFSGTNEPNAAKDFETHIKSLAVDIAKEIGVRGRLDTVRLETAISGYILYRRLYFRSLETSDKNYFGPFAKQHEKVARATLSWIDASNKAFENFNRLLRQLEVKYGKCIPEWGTSQVFVQNQQVNVEVSKSESLSGTGSRLSGSES